MRYRLMATYRGVPYEVGLGPSNYEVVLFAACPPPEELGFEPATGHWRKQVIRAEIDALWESRPVGTFRGEPCIVLDDPGDRLHIAYLGADADRAANLGYWQVDRGVFELLAPREEITGLIEERVDKPLRWGEQADGTGPMATYPYGKAPWPIAAPPIPAPQPAPEAAALGEPVPAANTALADASPADLPSAGARPDGAPPADTPLASATLADIPSAGVPHVDIPRASAPTTDRPPARAQQAGTQPVSAPPPDFARPSTQQADTQPVSVPAADVARASNRQAGTQPDIAPPGGSSRASAPTADVPVASARLQDVPLAGAPAAEMRRAAAPPIEIPRPSAPPAEIPRASAALAGTSRGNAPLTDIAPVSAPPVNPPAAHAPLTDTPPVSTSPVNAPAAAAPLTGAPLASAPLADVPSARAQRATSTLSADAQPTPPAQPTAPARPADTSFPAETGSEPLPVPPGFYDPETAAQADIRPSSDVGGRAARRQRVPTREIFCELADLASIPRSMYALETEVDGAMCLLPTPDGFDVFIAADGVRHELRSFADEEAAYFYLFGVLVAEAIRNGALAPAVAVANPYSGAV